jgi:hypothetical protein
MVQCLSCGKDIVEPRKEKGVEIQKFCNDRCRWNYHNMKKFECFQREMAGLLKKYGYLK